MGAVKNGRVRNVIELLTAAQMRATEASAMASGAVTGLELMERAGRGVVDRLQAQWPEMAAGSLVALVFCGPGNNGGDGFVIARLLRDAGWAVDVVFCGDADRMSADARANLDRWGGPILKPGEVAGRDNACDLVVDALFGIGLTRPVDPTILSVLADQVGRGGQRPPRVVSVDIASGLDADSGRALGDPARAVVADLTVTFHRPKLGHVLAEGPVHSGRVEVVDIGLSRTQEAVCAVTLEPADRTALGKGIASHKFGHGHALVLSGGVGRGGAARLAARGALRIGAGLVTVGCPPAALMEAASRLDAIMVRKVEDAEALADWLAMDDRITAICVGPGFGTSEREASVLLTILGGDGTRPAFGGRVVLDADALTLLARDETLFALLHDRCLLTPHGGEFARLFPDLAKQETAAALTGPAYSKVDATREAARRAGCTVLYKGPDTVIASPNGQCQVHAAVGARAAPWLATAGSGDVLAGFAVGLMARGFDPIQAARCATYLHADCARHFGPGLIAEDLPEALPAVLRSIGL